MAIQKAIQKSGILSPWRNPLDPGDRFYRRVSDGVLNLIVSGFSSQKLGELIPKPASVEGNGFLFPQITDAADIRAVDSNFPTKYDLIVYIGSDHSSGLGGIYMFLHESSEGFSDGWVSYDDALAAGDFDYLASKPSGNPIYVDTQYGEQTETPCVNVVDGAVFMSYHNTENEYQVSGFVQNTCLAKSSDGVQFTRYSVPGMDNGVMLATDVRFTPGNGHTGYFHWGSNDGLFDEIPEAYVGYSSAGGGTTNLGGFWVSDDAENWTLKTLISADWSVRESVTAYTNATIEPWSFDPRAMWRRADGYVVAICRPKQPGTFGGDRLGSIGTVLLSKDGTRVVSGVVDFLLPGGAGSYDELSQGYFSYIEYKGLKYIVNTPSDSASQRILAHSMLTDDVVSLPEIPDEISRAVYDFKSMSALPSNMSLQNAAGSIAFDANGANITVAAGVISGIVVDIPVDLSSDDVDILCDDFYQDNTEAVQIRIGFYDADDIDNATNSMYLVGLANTANPAIRCVTDRNGDVDYVTAGPAMGYGTSFQSNFKESPQAFKTLGIRHRPSESDTRMTYFDRWRIGFPAEAQTMPSGSYKLIFSIKNNGSNDATVTIGGIGFGMVSGQS